MEANLVINKSNSNDITLSELKETSSNYTKIVLKEFLEQIAPEHVVHELFQIKSKIKPGGTIQIQGYDLYELAYSIVNDKLSTLDFNNIIKDRKQLLSVPDLKSILEHTKFKIKSIDVDAYQYLVEATNE